MTWTSPNTVATGEIYTASMYNTYTRDNTLHLFNNFLPLAGSTMSGTLSMADNLITRPEIKDYAETVVTTTASSTAYTVNLENGNIYDVTLNSSTVILTFSNPPSTGRAGSFTFLARQDGTGGRTISWPASVDWPAAEAPVLSTGSSALDVLTFLTKDAGTTWLGFVSGQGMA